MLGGLGLVAQPLQMLDVPRLKQRIKDVGVVKRGIDAGAFSDVGKLFEGLAHDLAALAHIHGGHGDLRAHHIVKGEQGVVWIEFETLLEKELVGLGVAPLIPGDDAAHLRQ